MGPPKGNSQMHVSHMPNQAIKVSQKHTASGKATAVHMFSALESSILTEMTLPVLA